MNMNQFILGQQIKNRRTCGDCKYYQYIGGECQRHAPTVGKEPHHILFPHVEKDNWCGDFENNLDVGALKKELKESKDLYYQLIMAVSSEYPDESRHETVLRYINLCQK